MRRMLSGLTGSGNPNGAVFNFNCNWNVHKLLQFDEKYKLEGQLLGGGTQVFRLDQYLNFCIF